jgi:hypothetical protein
LAELVVVQMIGSIEDERWFSTLTFMKAKLTNQLMKHLELVIPMFRLEVLHCAKLPFWTSNSELGGKQNLIWCSRLKVNMNFTVVLCFNDPCYFGYDDF